MKKFFCFSVLFVLISSLAGCQGGVNSSSTVGAYETGLVKSSKSRDMSPDASKSDIAELVADNTAFALNTYNSLRTANNNMMFSPYSISLALAMVYAGAKSTTESEMASTLHYMLSQTKLHPAFNTLDLAITSRNADNYSSDHDTSTPFTIAIANSIWGDKKFKFLESYLDTLALNYGAGLRLLDFAGAPDASRVIINDWVSEQTKDKIKDLLPEGFIVPATKTVITNAIYFKASWFLPFEKENTSKEQFNLLDGTTKNVDMMYNTKNFNYTSGSGYKAVELPYSGRDSLGYDFSMVVILPDSGNFDNFAGSFTAETLSTIISGLSSNEVKLYLPKFTFSYETSVKEALQKLGMTVSFTGNADFSGMTGEKNIFISDVIHKAFVSVDEKGTEAAAATAVGMATSSAPGEEPEPVLFKADRPFIFLIRDVKSGTILFLGQVVNP